MITLDALEIGAKAKMIRVLLRGAQRYHFASVQDRNPIVAARHNAYAVALVDALRDIATEEEIHAATGVSLSKLREEVLAVQDAIEAKAIELLNTLREKGVKLPF